MSFKGKDILYYGYPLEESKHLKLKADSLGLVFENGDLRIVKLKGKELIRRIYFAVRDKNWDTVPNVLNRMEVEKEENRFSVFLEAQNYNEDINFKWEGSIRGEPDGAIVFSIEGEALKDFYKNRIGPCIHLPMDYAGSPCKYRKFGEEEKVFSSVLPIWISPNQPFLDLKSFSYQIEPGMWLHIFFEGDIFEMEDQRNWSDSSFKIYSTPLRYPFPVLVKKGERIEQSIKIQLDTTDFVYVSLNSQLEKNRSLITVGDKKDKVLCPLGFGFNECVKESAEFSSIIRKLSPHHLRSVVKMSEQDWPSKLFQVSEACYLLGVPLWLSLMVSNDVLPATFAKILKSLKTVPEKIMISKDSPPWNTTPQMVNNLRSQLDGFGENATVGGGTEAWFAELNRNRPPINLIDFIFWSITPQVHASDCLSLVENLATQRVQIESAIQFAANLPLFVGPVTLKMRFNPNATEASKSTLQSKIEIPFDVDPRQWGLFCAVWTLISIKYLSEGGACSGTYYELLGPKGLIYHQASFNQPAFDGIEKAKFYPVFHVFKELLPKQGARLYEATSSEPFKTDAMALEYDDKLIVYVVNFLSENQKIEIVVDGLEKKLSKRVNLNLMSETDWNEIICNQDYDFKLAKEFYLEDKIFEVELSPYSICKLIFELQDNKQ